MIGDVFTQRAASPMLITEELQPFDDPAYLYELKFDGIRCLAYCDGAMVDLRNKRGLALLPIFPELTKISENIRGRCILDGELVVMTDGKPDFERLQSRAMMGNHVKIGMAASKHPASYVAFDLIYRDDRELTGVPLEERKAMLVESVRENNRIAVSRIYDKGIDLFKLTEQQGLEGIVAKRKGSQYFYGKRSRDWVKIKNLVDEDFVACGYIDKGGGVTSLVLGKDAGGTLHYEGHVTLGVAKRGLEQFGQARHAPFATVPPGNESAVWFAYMPICTVVYMERTSNGGMRQPRFKGFKE